MKIARRQSSVPIPEWLVLGSFAHGDWMQLLDFPFLSEMDVAPSAGEKIPEMNWRTVNAFGGGVDLINAGLWPCTCCVAYAFAYVHAASAAPATLLMGSDDGLAVWLNGERVWRMNVERGVVAGQDRAPVQLAKGWNRLLLKISQHEGSWGFFCSIKTGVPLRFALKNPQPKRWPNRQPSGAHLGLVSLVVETPEGAAPALIAEIFNHGAKPAAAAEAVLTCGGAEVMRAPIPPCASLTKTLARFDAKDLELAAVLAKPGSKVLITRGGDHSVREITPKIVFEYLVALLARNPNAELARMSKQILQLCEVYPEAPESRSACMRRILTALADGKEDAAAKELKKIIEELAGQVAGGAKKPALAHLIGHAHIDMNWLWTWPETVKCSQDSFRQMLAFMDEFPDVTFLQSQPSAYRGVEKADPRLFKRIQERVREGRWELVGGAFSEGDTNMSSGEALCRTFLLGQRYFLDRFGKAAVIGWLPDNFGHVAQLPQVLRLAGCRYFYCCRTTPHKGAFWWESPDGSRVLMYSNENYNSQARGEILKQFGRYAPKSKRILVPIGVGDHGGGPTRKDIETAHLLDALPGGAVQMRFTSAEAFFKECEKEMAGRPTHKGECQYVFEGCYTTIARVKEGNRNCETALGQAEFFAVLRRLAGEKYPAKALREAWEIVAFNEFHDILCGSALHETNDDAAADYKWARTRAEDIRDTALRTLADEIKFEPAKGQPIVIFNATPRTQTAIAEAEVFTHDLPATTALLSWFSLYRWHNVTTREPYEKDLPTVLLRDPSGKAVPAQIVWGKLFPPGYRWKVQFLAKDLPAGGYRTYYLDPAKPGCPNEPLEKAPGVFESDYFKVGFDMQSGEIKSLFDKRTRTELAAKGKTLNRLRIYPERPHSMSAWTIGTVEKTEDVTTVESVKVIERGPVRAGIETVKRWGRSKFIQRTYVYRSLPRIDMELEAHWFEQGTWSSDSPMLRAVFPLAFSAARFACHTPFAAVERPHNGQETPAQQWVDVSDKKHGVALLTRTKYGYSLDKNELRLTLLRSSYDPDVYPDQGVHRIQYALFPHAGGWQAGRVWNEGEVYSGQAILGLEPPSLSLGRAQATRSEELEMLSLEPANVSLSGMKEAEEGGEIIVRVAETEGRAVRAKITWPGNLRAARRLDIIERPLEGVSQPHISGNTVEVAIKPHEIVTLGLQ